MGFLVNMDTYTLRTEVGAQIMRGCKEKKSGNNSAIGTQDTDGARCQMFLYSVCSIRIDEHVIVNLLTRPTF
jgi:hypothetical protein